MYLSFLKVTMQRGLGDRWRLLPSHRLGGLCPGVRKEAGGLRPALGCTLGASICLAWSRGGRLGPWHQEPLGRETAESWARSGGQLWAGSDATLETKALTQRPRGLPARQGEAPLQTRASGTGDLFLISSGCMLCSRQLVSGQWLQLQPLPPVTIRQINHSAPWRGGCDGLLGGFGQVTRMSHQLCCRKHHPISQRRKPRPMGERGLTGWGGVQLRQLPDPASPWPPTSPAGPGWLTVALSPPLNTVLAQGWATSSQGPQNTEGPPAS